MTAYLNEKALRVILLLCLTVFVGLGCSDPFPQSKTFQNIDLKGILWSLGGAEPGMGLGSSVQVAKDYAIRESEAILPVPQDKRDDVADKLETECETRIAREAGKVVGSGRGKGNSSSDRSISYVTSKTSGELRIYVTTIDKSAVRVIIIQFEARRRSF